MGYKKPAWKKQLEDAKQRNRDLDNTNHELQVEVLRLSKALADSEANAKSLQDERDIDLREAFAALRPQKNRPLTDIELNVLAGLMLLEALPATPARAELARVSMKELLHRGLVADMASEDRIAA